MPKGRIPASRGRSRTPGDRDTTGNYLDPDQPPPLRQDGQSWSDYEGKRQQTQPPKDDRPHTEQVDQQPDQFQDRISPASANWEERLADKQYTTRQALVEATSERVKYPDKSFSDTMRPGRAAEAGDAAPSGRDSATPPAREAGGGAATPADPQQDLGSAASARDKAASPPAADRSNDERPHPSTLLNNRQAPASESDREAARSYLREVQRDHPSEPNRQPDRERDAPARDER